VYAAASLKDALDRIVKMDRSGEKIVVSYGATSALARQIENGAPADIFLSADTEWMDYLAERKLIQSAARRDLLGNQLVLIAPPGTTTPLKIAPGFPLAARLGKERLAMANPDAVPAGKYGKTALERLGVWGAVSKQVARTDNVRGALALVARGEAPFGIVYRTDALADGQVVLVDTFPAASHAPIVYPLALTATAKPSAAHVALFLQSDKADAIWQQYGFQVLK